MVSAFFGHHTITKLNRGLIAGLAARGVEVVLVRWPGPIDGGWHDLARLASATVTLPQRLDRARVSLLEIDADVVHYPELGMHLPTQLLAMARLGRVQTVGWGHPVTTGITSLDAMLSVAAMEPAGAAAHYCEPLVGLPGPGLAFARPDIPALPALDLPAGRRYVCPQSLFKLHPHFDAILGALFAADPAGQLILIAGEDASWAQALLTRLQPVLDPQRVTVLPRLDQARFFSLLAAADVMLDVPQWSGGTSTLEALALGTPIVTLPGAFMRGRHTMALLAEAGLTNHIARDAADYAAIAERLAAGADRDQIRAAAAVLFDRPEPIDATLRHWLDLLDRRR
jgi:predicted O-linked N-acetylglucosamine transferase (SPINDLY family)